MLDKASYYYRSDRIEENDEPLKARVEAACFWSNFEKCCFPEVSHLERCNLCHFCSQGPKR
jgi:hypothetical protein